MATTLSIEEAAPEAYPQIVLGQTDPNIAKIVTVAWQRVEAWIAHRWGVRAVMFVAEGPGDWVPPLGPFTATTVESWTGSAWVTASVAPSPLGGYCLDVQGPFRFTGNCGAAGDPPQAVKEAVFRLTEYFLGVDAVPASERPLSKFRTSLEPYVDENGEEQGVREVEREQQNANWIARAMQLSGAADLLRPWRKLGSR